MGEHFCPECGFTADGPGDCPNDHIPMQSLGDELAVPDPPPADDLEPVSDELLKTPRPSSKLEEEEGEDLFEDPLPPEEDEN